MLFIVCYLNKLSSIRNNGRFTTRLQEIVNEKITIFHTSSVIPLFHCSPDGQFRVTYKIIRTNFMNFGKGDRPIYEC